MAIKRNGEQGTGRRYSGFTLTSARRWSLLGLVVLAGCQHGPWQGRAITLPYAAPFDPTIEVRPAIRRECDLERRAPREIASEIRGHFSGVSQRPLVDATTPGLALDLRIVHVEGKSGSVRGHKSLTIAGTLFENGTVIGDFVATRRTKRGRHTCRMLWNNIEEIGEDIDRWLEAPSRGAYLGDALPGDLQPKRPPPVPPGSRM